MEHKLVQVRFGRTEKDGRRWETVAWVAPGKRLLKVGDRVQLVGDDTGLRWNVLEIYNARVDRKQIHNDWPVGGLTKTR